ncbi:MAG: hypothetical protein E7637_03870 [Ruminococcaceae bacterium]|nr:hypothetical protein [Oscillospiraceae bacterium]
MTLAKPIGATILLLIGIVLSRRGVQAEKRRLEVLEAWIRLLYEIRTQIDCFSLPIQDVLKDTDQSLLALLGAKQPPTSLASLLQASRENVDKECARLLSGMVKEIGTHSRTEQVKRCDYYLTQLEKARDVRRAQLPGRIRLCLTLHLCVCLGSVILLW